MRPKVFCSAPRWRSPILHGGRNAVPGSAKVPRRPETAARDKAGAKRPWTSAGAPDIHAPLGWDEPARLNDHYGPPNVYHRNRFVLRRPPRHDLLNGRRKPRQQPEDRATQCRSLIRRDRSTVEGCQPRVAPSRRARHVGASPRGTVTVARRRHSTRPSRRTPNRCAARSFKASPGPLEQSRMADRRPYTWLRQAGMAACPCYKGIKSQGRQRSGWGTSRGDTPFGRKINAGAGHAAGPPGPLLEQSRLRPDHDAVALRSV